MRQAGKRAGQGWHYPRAAVLLCTVDLRLRGRRGREQLVHPLGSQSQDPRESREILGVCGWEVGGHLQGGPWKESSQSVKEKIDQSSLTLEEKHMVVNLGV